MQLGVVFARVMLATTIVTALQGCGGGGGGGGASAVTVLPTESFEVIPSGPRIDVGTRNLFPMGLGDAWYYDRADAVAGGTASRTVVSGPDADGAFTVNDIDNGDAVNVRYRPTSAGVQTLDPFQAQSDGLGGLYAALPSFIEYPMPPYPVGAELQTVRQGDAGADLDGDGKNDYFRIDIRQVFLGFETIAVLGKPTEVAHFKNTVNLTALRTRDGNASTVIAEEDAYFASDMGLVRAVRSSRLSTGTVVMPQYTLTLSSATVDGVDYSIYGTSRAVALTHLDLVADPRSNAFYANLPDTGGGARVARIDGASGAVTVSASLGTGGQALAISADGSMLYASVYASGEVVRLSLPDMRETGRVVLPADSDGWTTTARSLSVSPTDPNVVAVALQRRYAAPIQGGVAVIRDLVLQPRRTPEGVGATAVSFGADGWIYAYNEVAQDLRRIELVVDGAIERSVVTTGGFYSASFEAMDGLIVLGNRVYSADVSLAYIGDVPAHADCRKVLGRGTLLCHSVVDSRQVSIVDLTSLTIADVVSYTNRGVNGNWQMVPGRSDTLAVSEPETVTIFRSGRLP